MDNNQSRTGWTWILRVLVPAFLATAMALPVVAIPTGGDGGDDGGGGDSGGGDPITCLRDSTGVLYATPATVVVGQSTTLHWSVIPAPGCGAMTQSITGIGAVEQTGSMSIQVNEKRTWTLQGWHYGTSQVLGTTSVTTKIPSTRTVTISSDDQVWLFLQAIAERNTNIQIQNHVKLDLSNRQDLWISPGVTISGGRSETEPGPLLFTNTFPRNLFVIGGGHDYDLSDGVRISGIRLRGAELNIAGPDAENSTGMTVYSSNNIDISNCEIMGWRGSGVDVRDPVGRLDGSHFNKYDLRLMSVSTVAELPSTGRLSVIIAKVNSNLHFRIFDAAEALVVDRQEDQLDPNLRNDARLAALKQRLNPMPNAADLTPEQKHEIIRDAAVLTGHTGYNTVRVHDNYIHHNRHWHEEGYGVAVHDDGYVLIDSNVFNHNRHAISAQGKTLTGYYAERNLVLADGGVNRHVGGRVLYTHMLDVHGDDSCWGSSQYCGNAGEHFEFRDNTVLYDRGTGIKIRGRPRHVAAISGNVFSHDIQWGGLVLDGAMAQTSPEGNLSVWNNTMNVEFGDMHLPRVCDFNRDGVLDDFLATGATWWYLDGNHAEHNSWRYLNTSLKRKHQLRFQDVSGDGICDVIDNDGVTYTSGILRQDPLPWQVDIPYMIGDALDVATSTLTGNSLVVGNVNYEDDPYCQYIGVVSKQSPHAGKRVSTGTTVNLTVGREPERGCSGQPQ